MKKIILLFLNTLLLPLSIGSTGKNVLITGASRGVGFETAKLFADRGYTVYGVVRESSIVPSNRENIRWIAVDYRNEASHF